MTQRDAIEIGQAIKAERIKAGLSVRALANASGVDFSYISNLENGRKKNPSVEVLEKLARALSMNVQQIFNSASINSEGALPEPHAYLRRLGLSADDADHVAGIIAGLQSKKEVTHEKDD